MRLKNLNFQSLNSVTLKIWDFNCFQRNVMIGYDWSILTILITISLLQLQQTFQNHAGLYKMQTKAVFSQYFGIKF